jgi:hypothetical protein
MTKTRKKEKQEILPERGGGGEWQLLVQVQQ